MSWADDPELVATFRAEVEERLASLTSGLLQLEKVGPGRELLDRLFRDAHTVKGSARMLGLDAVVELAHRCEDVFGAVRDQRIEVSKALIDLLLAATSGIERQLPGAEQPLVPADAAALVAALEAARDGADVVVPQLSEAVVEAVERADLVRIPTSRVHLLVDTVGEAELRARHVGASALGIHRQLGEIVREMEAAAATDTAELLTRLESIHAAAEDLRRDSADAAERLVNVRDAAMALAMVPLRRVVTAFNQLVREVALSGGRDVDLVVTGADVELDARVLDGVADALRHLVTNAVDHGCATPAERIAAGKPPRATVSLHARALGAAVAIEVADDGAGIDVPAVLQATGASDLLEALCQPGFSTRSTVTTTSGRGVGLDVVRRAVQGLGGTLQVETSGAGTRFTLTVPVTLGVMRCLIARIGSQRYAIPVANIVESLDLRTTAVYDVAGRPCLLRGDDLVPIASVGSALAVESGFGDRAVLVRRGDQLWAWAVDELVAEREVVVKELGPFLGRSSRYPGASLDEEGRIIPLLDLRDLAPHDGKTPPLAAAAGSAAEPSPAARILIVEDSAGVRELQRSILSGAGYEVDTAVDGTEGAARLTGEPVDLVVSDVEMPGMDGFRLTRTIRRTPGWEQVPVVIMTSRGEEADQRAGLDAGADAYLLKSSFDSSELISTVRRLVGR